MNNSLNTLAVMIAADTSCLMEVMRDIRYSAPEAAETMLENCTQHFNQAIALAAEGKDLETIGVEFGCGEIGIHELFTMVANQAQEDLQVYEMKRDADPIWIEAGDVIRNDRILNLFTSAYENVTSAEVFNEDLTMVIITMESHTQLRVNPATMVQVKRGY